jgi:hypothetical protein
VSYSTAKEVIAFAGHKEEDFGVSDPGAYTVLVEGWIAQADAIIDADRGRTFDIADADVAYAPLLNNLSVAIAANIMAQAIEIRTMPVEKIDDLSQNLPRTPLVTEDIKANLKRLPGVAKLGLGIACDDEDE